MHPVLVKLGPLTLGALKIGPLLLRWYGAMMALAIMLAVPLSARMGEQFGIPRTLIVDSLAFPFMATLLVGARAGYVMSHLQEFAGDPLAAVPSTGSCSGPRWSRHRRCASCSTCCAARTGPSCSSPGGRWRHSS